jgi:HSP20 family protein
VRGRFNPETASDADTPHLQERYHGEFARAVRLPVPVDPEKVEARFENGILQVTLQKAEEALPRKIKVS